MNATTRKIVLSQTAPWNAALTNPYRTYWTLIEGRMFRVMAESLKGVWWVEEVDHDGTPLDTDPCRLTYSLAGARQIIAERVTA